MHELAVAERLVALVAEEATRAACVKGETVFLRLGVLSHVEPSSLELAFLAASQGTIAAGASLRVERTVAQAHCLSCEAKITVTQRGAPCPHCGAFELVVVGGDELRLVRLEVW